MEILENITDIFSDAFWSVFGEKQKTTPPAGGWVQWIHVTVGSTCCSTCIHLGGCWFAGSSHPEHPQHFACHCGLMPLDFAKVLEKAKAECDLSKFEGYIFNPKYEYTGKKVLFNLWGYDMEDSEMLQKEFEKQALEKYIKGDYKLGKLDARGQRISIEIELLDRNKSRTVISLSGWMVKPNGKITLTTPMAGGK